MGFQNFTDLSNPAAHPPRLAALRKVMAARALDGFLVPRADAHQGEYVADADARLRWLTGFSGSAGFAAITADRAGVFIDGRYRVQVKSEVDPDHFTPVPFPETTLATWLCEALPDGRRVGFDPWLHTRKEISELEAALDGSGITLAPVDNLVDEIWTDRPEPPAGKARLHPEAFAGETAGDKRHAIAAALRAAHQAAAVITLPDSICWLLNIRGHDVPRNPVVQGFAVIEDNGHVAVFADPAKFSAELRAALGNEVSFLPAHAFEPALANLTGPVRVDPATAPDQVFRQLEQMGTPVSPAPDPVILPKARKNAAEIAGMRDAHLRDAAAVVRCLHWIDQRAPDLANAPLTEIDVVRQLEQFRVAVGITDISFETICGTGPNGAINHYRVSESSNRRIAPDDLLLLDSGGQYVDGTTDITRTIPMGQIRPDQRAAYTRVLQGMIAVSRARFPRGLAGRDIDPLARAPLWMAGQNYDHGTGHGVGAALSVHEGPVRISRISEIPLEPGMILSNEPGYYQEGDYGIRIENLIVVRQAPPLGDDRPMLDFETLTFAPIDLRPIDALMLAPGERAWLNDYHAQVRDKIAPLVDGEVRDWLIAATRTL
ncbi:aminopeptidase P family protein [Paracoccus pacificus]|uniref:Aminopeptidase P family protein n=1 Tax=Paracoccus pacificus TaxID=1463598 RepID=A0ABW4R930_9RHOB